MTTLDDASHAAEGLESGADDHADPPSVRIRVHPGLCQGWGECHRWAPEVYPLGEDGRVDLHLAEVPPELALRAWLGARACPEQAITFIGPPDDYWMRQFQQQHRDRRAAHATDGQTTDGHAGE